MKVLTVVDPQIPLSKMHHVGATMLPQDLCQALSQEGDVEMSLLVYQDDPEITSLGNAKVVDLGAPKARYQQQVAQKLKEIINEYDVVHVHISTPGFVKYLVEYPKEVQKKIIYTMHTWTDSLAVSYFYRDYFDKLVTDSEVNIVFLTHKQATALLKSVGRTDFYNKDRIHFIKNAVNIERKPQIEKTDRAIAVGRMVESKGIDKIVTACIASNQKLLLVSPAWRMTPKERKYRDKVLDLISKAPEGLIELSEGMPHSELMNEIHKSQFSILFSTFDVFSLFILESINLGTPVLAYNAGSTSEVCDIFQFCGVTRFNKGKELVDLMRNKRYSQVDFSKYPQECTYDHFVHSYYDLYKTISQ